MAFYFIARMAERILIMWDDADQIRNAICGYDEPELANNTSADRARLASKLNSRKKYARFKAAGLNSRGKPFTVPQRANKFPRIDRGIATNKKT